MKHRIILLKIVVIFRMVHVLTLQHRTVLYKTFIKLDHYDLGRLLCPKMGIMALRVFPKRRLITSPAFYAIPLLLVTTCIIYITT